MSEELQTPAEGEGGEVRGGNRVTGQPSRTKWKAVNLRKPAYEMVCDLADLWGQSYANTLQDIVEQAYSSEFREPDEPRIARDETERGNRESKRVDNDGPTFKL